MTDKKNEKKTTTRRTEADMEARNKASVDGLIEIYGPRGDGMKKPVSQKKS